MVRTEYIKVEFVQFRMDFCTKESIKRGTAYNSSWTFLRLYSPLYIHKMAYKLSNRERTMLYPLTTQYKPAFVCTSHLSLEYLDSISLGSEIIRKIVLNYCDKNVQPRSVYTNNTENDKFCI